MSPVRRRLLALALPAVVLAGATGCASGSSGPSQEQYATMADDVCDSADENLDELFMEQSVEELRATTTDEAPVYVERPERWVRAKVVPAYESLSNRLKGLPRPEGDAAYLSDLYADLDARIEVLHRRPSDGRGVIESDDLLRDRFESYGMESCPPEFDEDPDYEDPAEVLIALAEQEEEKNAASPSDDG